MKENELKIIGKIDLDAINQRTRPIKKSKKQLEKERRFRTNTKKEELKSHSEKPQ